MDQYRRGMDQYRLWNAIGASFDATRGTPWRVVSDWLDVLPERRRILDLMGGNGRHARVARGLGHWAVVADWSKPLAASAARNARTVLADATRLPFCNGSFDAALYVAGLHGIPEAHGRRASLRELHRVLCPGASVLVTVWSRNAHRFKDGPPDVVVPWRRDGHEAARTYHLYTPQELRDALEEAGFQVGSCVDVVVGEDLNVAAHATA